MEPKAWAQTVLIPKVLHAAGNIEAGEGIEVTLKGPLVLFRCAADGVEIQCEIPVVALLMSIQDVDVLEGE